MQFPQGSGETSHHTTRIERPHQVLEEWLGQDVFKRAPSGSELTEAGRKLLVYARYMLHLRSHAKKAFSRKHSAAEWPLRLGYSPFINHMLIEEALTGYNEIVPDGRMNSSSDCTGHLIEMLENGRLDAAIVTGLIKLFLLSVFPVGTISLLCTTLEGVECQHSSGAQHRSAFASE